MAESWSGWVRHPGMHIRLDYWLVYNGKERVRESFRDENSSEKLYLRRNRLPRDRSLNEDFVRVIVE